MKFAGVKITTRLNVVLKTTEETANYEPRFRLRLTFRTENGNMILWYDATHWRCGEVIMDRTTDEVESVKFETRDSNDNVMGLRIYLVAKKLLT